jgi:prepilin-type N-terminal cleavage/methylation domain-containing protein
MKRSATRGLTLTEILIAVAIMGIVAAAALPLLSSSDPKKLDVAAEETANLLRFAFAEARRTNGYVLVDGLSTSDQLKLYYSNVNGQSPPAGGTSAIYDPLTKRPAVLDVRASTFSAGVTLTPQFKAGGSNRPLLLIGPGLTQMQGFSGSSSPEGALQANSGVQLSYGGNTITVRINQVTGLVTLP